MIWIKGISMTSSFGSWWSRQFFSEFHLAPSKYTPSTKQPCSSFLLISAGSLKCVTYVYRVDLSRAHPFDQQVV